MKALRTALIGLAVFAAMIAAFLSFPVTKTVTRSRTMNAPVAAVFAEASDLTRWVVWAKPSKPHAPGSDRADAQTWSWEVTEDPGTRATLRLTGQKPNEQVTLAMEYGERKNVTDALGFAAKGEQTEVVWTRSITLIGIQKLAPLIHTPESVVGPLLEEQLKNLDAAVSAPK